MFPFYHIVKSIHTGIMMKTDFNFLILFQSVWHIMEKLGEAKNVTSYYPYFSQCWSTRKVACISGETAKNYLGEC